MKKPEISFRHYGGSGPISIYWHNGPYGDAKEALKGKVKILENKKTGNIAS